MTPEQKSIRVSEMENTELTHRMIATVIFFLCSMYLTNHFGKKLKFTKEDESFNEEDYKKLFEFKLKP